MKKWSDMAGLPQEFIDKVNKLERNFAVSTVIFKKFEPIFSDIFQHPTDSHQNKQNRNKKQRYQNYSCFYDHILSINNKEYSLNPTLSPLYSEMARQIIK